MTSTYFWYIYTLAPMCDTSYGCGVVLSLIRHVASTSLQSKVILGSAVDILSRCGWMFTYTADCVSVRNFAYSVMVFIQNISYTYSANRVTWISLRN